MHLHPFWSLRSSVLIHRNWIKNSAFLKIPTLSLKRRKNIVRVLSDSNVNEWWQHVHFGANDSFNESSHYYFSEDIRRGRAIWSEISTFRKPCLPLHHSLCFCVIKQSLKLLSSGTDTSPSCRHCTGAKISTLCPNDTRPSHYMLWDTSLLSVLCLSASIYFLSLSRSSLERMGLFSLSSDTSFQALVFSDNP